MTTLRDHSFRRSGFDSSSVYRELPFSNRFDRGFGEYRHLSGILPLEVAMLQAMDSITDNPDWHKILGDSDRLARLKRETLASYKLLTESAWHWCLAELRDKAKQHDGVVTVYEAGSRVCKTDVLLDGTFNAFFNKLDMPVSATKASQSQVRDVIDPLMYPLIYGKTHVPAGGASATVTTCVPHIKAKWGLENTNALDDDQTGADIQQSQNEVDPEDGFWSSNMQQLPCDVVFTGAGTDVQIVSPVNNLNPECTTHYRCLEKIISASVKLWNGCLVKQSYQPSEPSPLRIPASHSHTICDRHRSLRQYFEEVKVIDRFLELQKANYVSMGNEYARPGSSQLADAWPTLDSSLSDEAVIKKIWQLTEECFSIKLQRRFRRDANAYRPLLRAVAGRAKSRAPEPGETLTYHRWKASSLRPPEPTGSQEEIWASMRWTRTSLETMFRKTGLQVIVRISEINVSPDQPSYNSNWQPEALLNEHVVGTAFYAAQVRGSSCQLALQQKVKDGLTGLDCGGPYIENCSTCRSNSDSRHPGMRGYQTWQLFGFRDEVFSCHGECTGRSAWQEIGTVDLAHGRLIALPRTLEHCIKVELDEGALSGHARLVVLSLVDPHYRICSTRDVPPQQHEWWDAILRPLLRCKSLPDEVIDMVLQHVDGIMSRDVAESYRAEYMQDLESASIVMHGRQS